MYRQRTLEINDENMNGGVISHQNEAFLDSDVDGQLSVSTIIKQSKPFITNE